MREISLQTTKTTQNRTLPPDRTRPDPTPIQDKKHSHHTFTQPNNHTKPPNTNPKNQAHGPRLVAEKFQGADGVADRVIELSIQIMLEVRGCAVGWMLGEGAL